MSPWQNANIPWYKQNKIQHQNTNETKYKHDNTKGINTNCQNTNVTKYKCNRIQIGQNTKIQPHQNTRGQNTNCQNKNTIKYKWNKIQKEQNAKIPKTYINL